MVQGLPAVKWTPENNAKLLAAIVCLHPGALDVKKLASVFGPNVPTAAINYRMSVLRKEGAALGLPSNGGPASSGGSHVPAKSIGRAAGGTSSKGKGRKRAGGMLSDDHSDDECTTPNDETEAEQELTPAETDSCENAPKTTSNKRQKTISGRVTKARVSPRKSLKKDYKALEDPFVAMNGTVDGDGNKVFDTDKSDSEDTYASDAEFAEGAKVKLEEAAAV